MRRALPGHQLIGIRGQTAAKVSYWGRALSLEVAPLPDSRSRPCAWGSKRRNSPFTSNRRGASRGTE